MARTHKRRWGIALVLLLLATLLVAQLILPVVVKRVLNSQLEDMGDYTGHVEDVGIALYRGAYQIRDLRIARIADHQQPVPFFRTENIDIGVSWRALWHGYVLADLRFDHPELNFVDSASEQGDQAGQGTDWRQVLNELVPVTINRVDIVDGVVAFRNFESEPPVNVQLTELNASATNLTNVNGIHGNRVASLEATGLVLNHADLSLKAEFDPFKEKDFVVALKFNRFSLPMLNPLAQAYASLDFAAGTGELVSELQARDGKLTGYVRPLLKNVDILNWDQDVKEQGDGPFQLAWEGLDGGLAALFTDGETDQIATQIDVEGTLDDPQISTWDAVVNALQNAFVEAYSDRFEGLFERATDEQPLVEDTPQPAHPDNTPKTRSETRAETKAETKASK